MPTPVFPFQNQTLGLSPEILGPYWDQYQFSESVNGTALMGIATDCAVVYQLTTAQLLALNATAVQLVAPPVVPGGGIPTYLAPPAGYLYVPTTMTLAYKFGGTAFTIGGTTPVFQIEYTGKAVSLLSMTPTGLVDQAVNTLATNFAAATGPVLANTNCANLGLEIKLGGTAPLLTLGTGTVLVSLIYNTYALQLL
jgi:hypothetical protein